MIICLVGSITISQSVILDCTYAIKVFWNLGEQYTCTGRLVFSGDARRITEVAGFHLTGKSNDDVLQLVISDKNVKLVPQHIGAYFTNLNSLAIHGSSLGELSKADFAGLPKLKEVHFSNNHIKLLVNDLFVKNPALKWISFINNPITNIGYNVFDHLADLTNLRFDDVACYSAAPNDPAAVKALISKLFIHCPPNYDMTFDRIKESILKEAADGKAIQIDLSKMEEKAESEEKETFEIKRLINDHENRIIVLENDKKIAARGLFR